MGRRPKPPIPVFAVVMFLFLMNVYTQIPSCVTNPQQQWEEPSVTDYSLYLRLIQSQTHDFHIPSINATSSLPDIGLEALLQSNPNYPKQRVSLAVSEKLYLIYGLESSGTLFVTEAILSALGLHSNSSLSWESADQTIHVQHLTLPMASDNNKQNNRWGVQHHHKKKSLSALPKEEVESLSMIPVVYPRGCRVEAHQPSVRIQVPEACWDVMEPQVWSPPYRYFVNITSHVQWYRQRGVKVYPIMVVRDPMLHFLERIEQGNRNGHLEAAYQEFEQGRAIMVESLQAGIQPVIVSYETLLTLQGAYLRRIYYQLGIRLSSHYQEPAYLNDNTPRLHHGLRPDQIPYVEQELLKEYAAAAASPDDSYPFHRRQFSRPRIQFKHFANTTTTMTKTTTADQLSTLLLQQELHQTSTMMQQRTPASSRQESSQRYQSILAQRHKDKLISKLRQEQHKKTLGNP